MTNHFLEWLIWRLIIGTLFHKLQTAGGYPLDEVASVVQKAIRRGEEELALFFAQELESRYPYMLWRRLIVCAHEDVGLADPDVIAFVALCEEQYWQMQAKHQKVFSLPVINAVLRLCRAPKSREADYWYSIIYQSDEVRLEIPDWALDKHTARGRQLGRGVDHFYDEGAVLSPSADTRTDLRDRAREIDKHKKERPWLTARKGEVKKGKKGELTAVEGADDEQTKPPTQASMF